MKSPGPRHVVAILRSIIGLGQREFAELVGRSPRTIQSIEINRLPLSEDLATRIAAETSVAVGWLLEGNLKKPPRVFGPLKVPYTVEHFERTRALLAAKRKPTLLAVVGADIIKKEFGEQFGLESLWVTMMDVDADKSSPLNLPALILELLAVIRAATYGGRQELAIYRLQQFVDGEQRNFGIKVDNDLAMGSLETLDECKKTLMQIQLDLEAGTQLPFFYSPSVDKGQWENVRDSNTPGMARKEAKEIFRKNPVLYRDLPGDEFVVRKYEPGQEAVT